MFITRLRKAKTMLPTCYLLMWKEYLKKDYTLAMGSITLFKIQKKLWKRKSSNCF